MQVIGSGLPPRPGRASRRPRPGSQGPHLSGSAQRARQGPAAVPVVPANPRGSLKGPSPAAGTRLAWNRPTVHLGPRGGPAPPHAAPASGSGVGGDVHARLALETPHRHCLEPAPDPAPPPPLGSPPALRQRPAQPLPGPTTPSRSWRAQSLQVRGATRGGRAAAGAAARSSDPGQRRARRCWAR